MSKTKLERTPLNAEGDFYVEKDMCITCLAPEQEAPELMGLDEATGCYFKRQPQTPEELENAIEAVHASCVAALRYAGSDPEILERLRAKGEKAQCDVLSRRGDIEQRQAPDAPTRILSSTLRGGAGDTVRRAADQTLSIMTKSGGTIRDFASGRQSRMTTAGVIWTCAAQFFVAQVVAQSRWTTPFSLATNYISDLGITTCGMYPAVGGAYVCSPWHTLMNMSFVLQGVIILVGAVLARQAFPGRRWVPVVFVLLVVTGLGIAGVGLFPADVNNEAHVISAGTQFITGNAAMIVFGVAANRVEGWRAFAVVSTALGITGVLATLLFANGYGFGLGVGGMERVAAYTLPVWLITSGVLMVARKRLTSAPPDNSFNPTPR